MRTITAAQSKIREHFLRSNGKKETGEKYLIQPKGDRVTWLCGLYRFEDGLPHFVVLTRPPSEEISFIHDRMPLMLRENDVDEWISPDAKPDEVAYRAVAMDDGGYTEIVL